MLRAACRPAGEEKTLHAQARSVSDARHSSGLRLDLACAGRLDPIC
jgi:hypothetical protein